MPTAAGDSLAVTYHARDQFAERFPGEDFDEAFARSEPMPFSRLMNWYTADGRRWRNHFLIEDEYRYDAVTQALFVIARHEAVVTVELLRRKAKAKRRRDRDDC